VITSTSEQLGQAIAQIEDYRVCDFQESSHEIGGRILTHLWDLDAMTQGLRRGSLVILAGSTGMGKTTFALNLAYNISAYSKVPVVYGGYDSPPQELIYKLLASQSEIESGRIKSSRLTETEWPVLGEAISAVRDLPLFFFDRACSSLQEICSYLLEVEQQAGKPAGVLVLDQLQLLPLIKSGSEEDIEQLIVELRCLAEDQQICVILLAQANLSAELRNGHLPHLNDLPAINAMQAWAEVIAFLHRDEYWSPDSPMRGEAELIIAKNRDNPVGTIRFEFMPQYSRFSAPAQTAEPTRLQPTRLKHLPLIDQGLAC